MWRIVAPQILKILHATQIRYSVEATLNSNLCSEEVEEVQERLRRLRVPIYRY